MRTFWILGGIVMLGLAGCATITKGTSQSIAILTPGVTGATCTLTSDAMGSRTVTTPAP